MGDNISISHVTNSTIIVNSTLTNVGIFAPPTPEALTEAEALLASLPTERVPAVAALPTPHRMKWGANPLFVGREADMQSLAASLKAGTMTVVAAVAGMGGVGKTQLASEFAHRYGQYFAGGVFWLSFADAKSVDSEIAVCGEAMGLSLNDRPLPEIVRAVRQAWENSLPRLLVFDNCEDEQLLHEYALASGGCRVLLTSRRRNWDSTLGVACHALGVLPRAESIDLLRRFRPDLGGTDDRRRTTAANWTMDDRRQTTATSRTPHRPSSIVHRPLSLIPASTRSPPKLAICRWRCIWQAASSNNTATPRPPHTWPNCGPLRSTTNRCRAKA